MAENVFVVGLDDFNRRMLGALPNASAYRFHGVLDVGEVIKPESYDMLDLLHRAEERLKSFDGSIDGLCSYIDFPVSEILPLLRERFGLPGPSLAATLACEHKYWSRLEQSRAVPECTPQFELVDPFRAVTVHDLSLAPPFWLKPVKSHSSHLGFRIDGERDFQHALETIRREIGRIGEPFDRILDRAEMPDEVAGVGGYYCVAEEIISAGHQCTLEGYVHDGRPHVYGAVDSVRYSGESSFQSYRYPSALPEEVQRGMSEAVGRFLERIGFDGGPFNAELFYDADRRQFWLLEVNPRISQSHCDLFQKVDGSSHHLVMVEMALGREPRMPQRQGEFPCAGKFFMRGWQDAIVEHVPDEATIREVERRVPGTLVRLEVDQGTCLSELRDQDSYSYELGTVFVGGEDPEDLERRYHEVVGALDLRLSGTAREPAEPQPREQRVEEDRRFRTA